MKTILNILFICLTAAAAENLIYGMRDGAGFQYTVYKSLTIPHLLPSISIQGADRASSIIQRVSTFPFVGKNRPCPHCPPPIDLQEQSSYQLLPLACLPGPIFRNGHSGVPGGSMASGALPSPKSSACKFRFGQNPLSRMKP